MTRVFWHSRYSCCQRCGRTRYAHKAKGLCEPCYRNWQKVKSDVSLEEFAKTAPPRVCRIEDMAGPPQAVRRGVTVSVPKYGVVGECLTDPYPWPRQMPTEMVVDVQGFASVMAEIPLRMVVPV